LLAGKLPPRMMLFRPLKEKPKIVQGLPEMRRDTVNLVNQAIGEK